MGFGLLDIGLGGLAELFENFLFLGSEGKGLAGLAQNLHFYGTGRAFAVLTIEWNRNFIRFGERQKRSGIGAPGSARSRCAIGKQTKKSH
jgi:hypothetical protein